MKNPLFTTFLIISQFCVAFGQAKLPSTQDGSVRAPADARVDGNLAEWHDTTLKAYNKTTRLFYLLANDDKYLYLAVRSTDATNIAKIEAGGITLTINTAGRKKDKDAFALTFPFIQRSQGGGRRGRGGFASDSASRQQFVLSAKEIKVSGFKDIDDTLISIYNEYRVKAAINFDHNGVYCYELAIPLTLLGLDAAGAKEIAYNIKLNGLQTAVKTINISGLGGDGGSNLTVSGLDGGGGFKGVGGGRGGGGRGFGGGGGGGNRGSGGRNSNIDYAELTSPTDFWATYTLAK
jgi:hypothetical protein